MELFKSRPPVRILIIKLHRSVSVSVCGSTGSRSAFPLPCQWSVESEGSLNRIGGFLVREWRLPRTADTINRVDVNYSYNPRYRSGTYETPLSSNYASWSMVWRRNRIANSANLHTARCSLLSLPFESTASIKKLCSGLEKFVKVIEFAAINISKIKIVAVEVKF